ncbi:MAG: membrane protein insertase YidC [Chromatiales bacterium 21-64-14]|nr:MAG: membrane protein insertase YidC [Chromatiales bacterium 21-64-14]HQU14589.1 membrane protein insertase YidC [Gammaproteobacteria bacterium]
MDNQRLLLFIALSFVLLLMWQAWMKDYGEHPVPPASVVQGSAPTAPPLPSDLPTAGPAATPGAAPAPAPAGSNAPKGQLLHVHTDVLDVVISTTGGSLQRAALPEFAASEHGPRQPVVLLDDQAGKQFLAQSGLLGADDEAPTHHAQFTAERTDYRLAPGAQQLQVHLRWDSGHGVTVDKIYTFHRNSYVVHLQEIVHNAGPRPWKARPYEQLMREPPATTSSMLVHNYVGGGVMYSPEEKYQKIPYKEMSKKNLNRAVTGGWLGMDQHYFLVAWLPPSRTRERFYTKALEGGRYVIGTIGSELQVAAGQTTRVSARLYVGPKLQGRLTGVAPGLELTVDYGYLTILAKPIFAMLRWIHGVIGNWGWAIVILTVLIKLAFYKLSETSYRSMANMRRLAPRLKALKERYGDDRQRLNQAMMDIYKEEKINPLGGCLPIVVQIPVFIALYWVLLNSMELRQAPFVLWIHDLSAPDPYFVLPILNGITMLVQQRLNPSPLDPMQQKIMMIMPLMFSVFFAFFPAGLVLYWLVNNMLSITQQWVITRRVEKAAK